MKVKRFYALLEPNTNYESIFTIKFTKITINYYNYYLKFTIK